MKAIVKLKLISRFEIPSLASLATCRECDITELRYRTIPHGADHSWPVLGAYFLTLMIYLPSCRRFSYFQALGGTHAPSERHVGTLYRHFIFP